MTSIRIGVFVHSERHSSLIKAFDYDDETMPPLSLLLSVIEESLMKDKEMFASDSLFWDTAEGMAADEDYEGEHYNIAPADLAALPAEPLPLAPAQALAAVYEALEDQWGFKGTPSAKSALLARFDYLLAEAEARSAANHTVPQGTEVYTSCACGVAYPDLKTVKFDAAIHDARKVLLRSEVGKASATGLTFHPLPPHLRKQSGNFWVEIAGEKAYAMGLSQKALKEKVAVHRAWVAKFGDH